MNIIDQKMIDELRAGLRVCSPSWATDPDNWDTWANAVCILTIIEETIKENQMKVVTPITNFTTVIPEAVCNRIVGACHCGEELRLPVNQGPQELDDQYSISRWYGDSANGYQLLHRNCLTK